MRAGRDDLAYRLSRDAEFQSKIASGQVELFKQLWFFKQSNHQRLGRPQGCGSRLPVRSRSSIPHELCVFNRALTEKEIAQLAGR